MIECLVQPEIAIPNNNASPLGWHENDLSNNTNDDLEDNLILKNLECDIDPDQQDEMLGDDEDETEMREIL